MEDRETAIIASDMSVCEPASSLSWEDLPDRWRLYDYETEEGVSGILAYALPDEDPGEIRLPISLKGAYEIYVGINYTRAQGEFDAWSIWGYLQLKLERDTGFRRFTLEIGWRGYNAPHKVGRDAEIYRSIQECYWRTADLTCEKAVVIRTVGEPYRSMVNRPAGISYIKFVPVGDED